MNIRNEYLEFKFDCPKLDDVKHRHYAGTDTIGNAIGTAVLALCSILLIWAVGAML